jgi:hypothetical protein
MCFFLYRMVMMPLHRDKNEERERRKTLSPRKRKWVSLHQLMHLSTPCSRVHPQGKLSHFCHKFCSQGHGEFQNFAILIMTVILTSKIYLEFVFGMPNLQYVEILIMYESNPTVHNSPAQGLVDMSLWAWTQKFCRKCWRGGGEIGICCFICYLVVVEIGIKLFFQTCLG